ncbi:hypothetical protein H4R24_000074 [Coemansia sp. RSA 988]|nr:hypothetical protein H4R24_000074 [Coemansia sp. RSA 988]
MRTIGLLGFAAASVVASTMPSDIANGASSAIKPFRPILQHRESFLVHNEPITLQMQASKISSDGSALVGTMISDELKDIGAAVLSFLGTQYNVSSSNMRVTNAYTDDTSGITHVYVIQTVNGVDITNAVANINVSKDKKVISSSHSLVTEEALIAATKELNLVSDNNNLDQAKQALALLASHLGIPLEKTAASAIAAAIVTNEASNQPYVSLDAVPDTIAISGTASARRAYVQQADGSLVSTWRINAEQQDHWWNANIDVAGGKVISLVDWYANSESYYVYPKDVNSPAEGSRKMLVDPANMDASPKGWVTEGSTYGNNVWAQSNPTGGNDWQNNHRPKAQSGNVFNYTLDLSAQPPKYVDAAITQLFYTNNLMHDLSYIYGFDEAAGNFQDVNYSGKGADGDAVIANAQDGSGTNNANFATPPDGQRPRMRMYVWTMTSPRRDGDLEQDIVAHEYTHGISNRLTGGPANSDCLDYGESGGLGEGWSDAVANIIRLKSTDTHSTDMLLGDYVYTKTIRNYAYSTSMSTNPSTYKYLDRSDYQEVHAIGEVWGVMLYEVMWALIDKNGFSEDLFEHDLSKGNTIMLQILLDGMKLQPCTPSFIDARNAIIQAEKNLTGGKNTCVIWAAFAKRGLGAKASGSDGKTHNEDNSVPEGC